jgi:hypothetical protein
VCHLDRRALGTVNAICAYVQAKPQLPALSARCCYGGAAAQRSCYSAIASASTYVVFITGNDQRASVAESSRLNPGAGAGMGKKPGSPKPASWDVYKIAEKVVWLGTVETPDKQAAQEFKTEVLRLQSTRSKKAGRCRSARGGPRNHCWPNLFQRQKLVSATRPACWKPRSVGATADSVAPAGRYAGRRRRITDLLSQTEQRGAPIVGKTVSNRELRVVVTETRRHKLRRCKASDDGVDSPACSILRKGRARMYPARGIRYRGASHRCHG